MSDTLTMVKEVKIYLDDVEHEYLIKAKKDLTWKQFLFLRVGTYEEE